MGGCRIYGGQVVYDQPVHSQPTQISMPSVSYQPQAQMGFQNANPYMPSIPQFSPHATPKEKLGFNPATAMSEEETLKYVSIDNGKLVFRANGLFRGFTTQNVDSRGAVDCSPSFRDFNTTAKAEGYYIESKVGPDGINNIKIELDNRTSVIRVDFPGQKTFWLDRESLMKRLGEQGSQVNGNSKTNESSSTITSQLNQLRTHSVDSSKNEIQLTSAQNALALQDKLGQLYGVEAKISLGEQMLANLSKIRNGFDKNVSPTEDVLRETVKILDQLSNEADKSLVNPNEVKIKERIHDDIRVLRNLALGKLNTSDGVIPVEPLKPDGPNPNAIPPRKDNKVNTPRLGDPSELEDYNAGPRLGDPNELENYEAGPRLGDPNELDDSEGGPRLGNPNELEEGPRLGDPRELEDFETGPRLGDPSELEDNNKGPRLGNPNELDDYKTSSKNKAKIDDTLLGQFQNLKNEHNEDKRITDAAITLNKIKSSFGNESVSLLLDQYKGKYGADFATVIGNSSISPKTKPFYESLYGSQVYRNLERFEEISGQWWKDADARELVRDMKKSNSVTSTIKAWNEIKQKSSEAFEKKVKDFTGIEISELLTNS